MWAEEQQAGAQLTQAGRDFTQHIGDGFPQKYLYEEAVAFCAEMVRDHRASSVAEAINLYETELHRRCVEDMQAATFAEQQRTQKLVAVGNVVNAAMTGAAVGGNTPTPDASRYRRSPEPSCASPPEQVVAQPRRARGERDPRH